MKTSPISLFAWLAVISILLSSCASKKDILYFQDIDQVLEKAEKTSYSAVIQPNDLLQIVVSSYDLKAVQPFNLPVTPSTNLGGNVNAQMQLQTYLVDGDGNIEFPVLGTLNVAGMKRQELIKDMETRISEYVVDPIINIRIMNYKVTVIGEVLRPGSYPIQDERITLPEALGMAGDMTVYGKRKEVLVIREENGVKKHGTVDLTSASFIHSPFYYLQQNDVVYVQPNKAQVQASAYNRNIPIFVSISSVLVSLIILFTR
ncbi:polysaccharide export protein [Robertkochia marina]|uniref:Polysaccharide export protein n=1 Tax=Robertkochia marina TaxID=1227945 RepID=A0A4S3M126_9FLAO|nr:polysaccharide biosynthesis/export family protein [Robertkochia marina]THD67713.1 polysaccharide export protein [Robertkochia marina]TRZ43444.1 polysaccharide export protein [Robertkochia marina]